MCVYKYIHYVLVIPYFYFPRLLLQTILTYLLQLFIGSLSFLPSFLLLFVPFYQCILFLLRSFLVRFDLYPVESAFCPSSWLNLFSSQCLHRQEMMPLCYMETIFYSNVSFTPFLAYSRVRREQRDKGTDVKIFIHTYRK